MPFKSKAQTAFMHAQHPSIAKRWDKETPDPQDLPDHYQQNRDTKDKLRRPMPVKET